METESRRKLQEVLGDLQHQLMEIEGKKSNVKHQISCIKKALKVFENTAGKKKNSMLNNDKANILETTAKAVPKMLENGK